MGKTKIVKNKVIKFSYHRLEDAFHLYLVRDNTDKEYATFQLIDAPCLSPEPGCKHMDLNFSREFILEIAQTSNHILLRKVFLFIFNSALEITHDLKGYKLCKLYSNDEMVLIVYSHFAAALSKKKYDVKTYSNWIEVRKKDTD